MPASFGGGDRTGAHIEEVTWTKRPHRWTNPVTSATQRVLSTSLTVQRTPAVIWDREECTPISQRHFTHKDLPKMMEDIKKLHKYGIVNWDIRQENYRNGKLVDFTVARATPHTTEDLSENEQTHHTLG
ncbi:hypothetical protein HIM_08818 [Hirsutella minnesotensis 3608]|uniref:Uncharacterized protein n=1 Tax=Hirsutella minnesotensis 3608 TaxID=1043627 RepID=A0A0F7ZSR0_9HYPO|nr:hypothetical protein HIM_08818 [Hirsutella minnesotensis 3608]